MLLLALCAGCAGAAVEYSGRCVAAPAPPPRCAMQGTRPINFEVDTAKRPKRSSAGLDLET